MIEIWDFETRAVARELVDERSVTTSHEHSGPGAVLSVNWSANGTRLLAAYADGSVTVWDVEENDTVFRAVLDAPLHDARLSPNSNALALVAPSDESPMTFALNRGRKRTTLPQMPGTLEVPSLVCRIPTSGWANAVESNANNQSPGHAVFSNSGRHAFVAGARGVITVVETATADIVQACKVPDSQVIKRLELSKCGNHLLAVSNSRTIASYNVDEDALINDSNNISSKNSPGTVHNAFDVEEDEEGVDTDAKNNEKDEQECQNGILTPAVVFQNEHSRGQWSCASFSHDGRFVVAASSGGAHELHVWDRESGKIQRIAVGAEASKGVAQIATHPLRSVFVVLGANGMMYVWSSTFSERWSAFEPNFVELDDNEEYVEREDEFDAEELKLARDEGDVSGSVAKALGVPRVVAKGASVEAAVGVTETEEKVRKELEAMEKKEAAEAEVLAKAESETATGQATEGMEVVPKTEPNDPTTVEASAMVVALVDTAQPLEGEEDALVEPHVRVIDQSAVLQLIETLRGNRSAAAAAAATEAEKTSLEKCESLKVQTARANTAKELAAKEAAIQTEIDHEAVEVDIFGGVLPKTFEAYASESENHMRYLPLQLSPDPDANTVIAVRKRRWREREERLKEEETAKALEDEPSYILENNTTAQDNQETQEEDVLIDPFVGEKRPFRDTEMMEM